MTTLTIRTQDGHVSVPCRLMDAVTFEVFLPSRGIRKFAMDFTSRCVAEAEIADVVLAAAETDPRLPADFDLDEDEAALADEAAGDLMIALGEALGQRVTRHSTTYRTGILDAIAAAYSAEVAAYEAGAKAWVALHGKTAPYTAPHPSSVGATGLYESRACRMLETYLEQQMDAVVLAQSTSAQEAQSQHANETEGDSARSGSEAGYSGRGIGEGVTL